MAYKCRNCGKAESKHCKECDGCPENHSGTCSKSYPAKQSFPSRRR